MKDNKIGTTAYNRPHQAMIHYSAKGYDEYRADLIKRLQEQEFVLKDDDFINAFIDLTAYLGEVLMTYQNAYAQEIYLETAQLRESLFNLAVMVDYRVDPGAAATGTLVAMAKPNKSGLLPKGALVSGKEEGAKKAVFFETDIELKVDAQFNDFTLAESERFDDIVVGSSESLTITEKIDVKTGQYLYFHQEFSPTSAYFWAQVQSVSIDEKKKTTTLHWDNSSVYEYNPESKTLKVGLGNWAIVNDEEKGVLKLSGTTLWLDGKYENISQGDPVILKKKGASNSYGIISRVTSELKTVKTGDIRWISENPADTSAGEGEQYQYTIQVLEGTSLINKTFYALKKDITEVREVTKLTLEEWLLQLPEDYTPAVMKKSPDRIVYAGIHKTLNVQEKEENTDSINGETSLTLNGDFSKFEKYRPLLLHEIIDGVKTVEEVSVFAVTPGSNGTIEIELRNSIGKNFSKHGVKIWGNVVKVTQGKTVPNQILGSGRGDESYQTFELPQSSLTYERRGREGIKGAIDVRVSDLPWQQQADFLNSKPEDRHYVIETDFDEQSRVVFGDGVNGSRLPTGRDNVIATFRTGQGTSGNVSAGVVKKPVSKPPFFKELFNPDNTTGGSDPDTEEQLREKIPVEHLTFDRAVSLQDYADLALAYPGIGKAKAGWRWRNNKQYVFLAVAGEAGETVSPLLKDLRDYLDARRDINQPLIVKEVDKVSINLTISVTALPEYDTEKVKDTIEHALGTGVNEDGTFQFFHFDRLKIGMSIHKKDIYHIVEHLPGADLITELQLERSTPSGDSGCFQPSFCSGDIWINNWELAVLDVSELDVVVTQAPVNKICERTGG